MSDTIPTTDLERALDASHDAFDGEQYDLEERQSLRRVQGLSTELMNQGRDALIDLARGEAALYRSINLKSQNVEASLIRAAKDDSTQSIKGSHEKLAALKLEGLSLDRQILSDAVNAIDAYAAEVQAHVPYR